MSECEFCGRDSETPQFYANGEQVSLEYSRTSHDCHCLNITVEGSKYPQRIAWGICCARHTVGPSLMKEEDYHNGVPWAQPEDCTCERKKAI